MPLHPTRSTPFGFWRFSAEYLLAARAVRAAHGERVLFPLLYLYGLSIELALKAFLLRRGESLSRVKNLSHRLTALLDLARKRKLGREVRLAARQLTAIRTLGITYSSDQLRYIVTGVTSVPSLADLAEAAEVVVIGLEQFCTGHNVFFRRKHAG